MNVKLIHIDGKLPNLALMRLAAWHKHNKANVSFTHSSEIDMFEPEPDQVYASSIFKFSEKKRNQIKMHYPDVIMGGTGTSTTHTLDQYIDTDFMDIDYSIYPDFPYSIGFSQRGCRMKCKFCVVPTKEGKVKEEQSIHSIWRGKKYPKEVILLDNDFFGQPNWKEKAEEIITGNFKVCFTQGVNVRLINDESVFYLSRVKYYDSKFQNRRLYTAWDNLNDEALFLRKIRLLLNYGIKPRHIMVYMLIGFKKDETWEEIFHRFTKMTELGLLPYPMVYNNERKDLKKFQRWAVRGYYRFIRWEDFK